MTRKAIEHNYDPGGCQPWIEEFSVGLISLHSNLVPLTHSM